MRSLAYRARPAGLALACFCLAVGACGKSQADDPAPPPVHYATVAHASLGVGADLNGDVPFPADNAWNTDISDPLRFPVDPLSDAIIAHIGAGTGLHPDFGPPPYGIPFVVVDRGQPLVPLTINAGGYAQDSDVEPMPIPPNAPIEGSPGATDNDAHVIVIERGNGRLYELWHARFASGVSWSADASAIFDLSSNAVRPRKALRCDVTSADAAGLPIFPGLVRYDEVSSGSIRHALRFTVESSRRAFVPPATHWASDSQGPNRAPMGMRVRLKADYQIPGHFSRETRVILQALKTYGMFVADNGSNWFISGATDRRWPIETIADDLRKVKGSHFEVLRMQGLTSSCP